MLKVQNTSPIRVMESKNGYADFSIMGGKLKFTCGSYGSDYYTASEDHFILSEEDTRKYIKSAIGREDAALEIIIFYLRNHAFTTSHFEKTLDKFGIKYVREHENIKGIQKYT